MLLTVPFTHDKRTGLLLAYYIMIACWGCAGLALSIVTRNVAGQTNKLSLSLVTLCSGQYGMLLGYRHFALVMHLIISPPWLLFWAASCF